MNCNNPPDDLKIYELSLIWKEATYNFAFWNKLAPTLDWDKAYRAAIPAVLKTQNLYEYYLELMKFTALLRDGHSGVDFPQAIKDSAEFASKLPIKIIYSGGNYVISNVKKCANEQVKRWSIIKKINGIDIEKHIEENIFPYIWHEKIDSAQYWIYEFLSWGKNGSQVELELEHDGQCYTVELTRTKGDANWVYPWQPLQAAEALQMIHKSGSHQISLTYDNISVITIDTFMDNNLPDAFYANFPLLEKAKGYVIDIRNNGGGNSSNADAIAACFIKEGFANHRALQPVHSGPYKAWGKNMMLDEMSLEEAKAQYGDSDWLEKTYHITHQSYFEISEYNYEDCHEIPGRLDKPLILLTTANTASASEDFLITLEHTKRATFVGTASCGTTGQPLTIELESGGTVRICTRQNTHIDGREFINIGVLPHVKFEPSLEDLAQNIDTHLAKGLEVLRQKIH